MRGPARNSADPPQVIAQVAQWLAEAQDRSATNDGGIARDYSFHAGWAASYPETSGYIIPTFLDLAAAGHGAFESRARRALDWLVTIQFPEGGYQGGKIGDKPKVPVTFNTGQILLGLAAGAGRWPVSYLQSMVRAAVWLRDSQDRDGAWRKHPTPFAAAGEKAYETHVAWGLLEAARVMPQRGFAEAGLRNIEWALSKQLANGWFRENCLEDPRAPLTHTIGYVLRGLVEGWRYSGDPSLLKAAHRTAKALETCVREDGWLPGRLNASWSGTVPWVCLTGSAQVAACWILLAESPGASSSYLRSARACIGFVRRSISLQGPDGVRGGVKGSYPLDGGYGRMQYLNWAAKFYLDAEHLLAAAS